MFKTDVGTHTAPIKVEPILSGNLNFAEASNGLKTNGVTGQNAFVTFNKLYNVALIGDKRRLLPYRSRT